jgi:hypothetical protein
MAGSVGAELSELGEKLGRDSDAYVGKTASQAYHAKRKSAFALSLSRCALFRGGCMRLPGTLEPRQFWLITEEILARRARSAGEAC